MSSPTQPTVLVVDDEADLRQLIAESLSADGFEVAQAADAADAIERLKNFAYDALVVDLRLPDADGMEVLDAALSRYPDILAVMVTGFGGVTEAVSAMKRGASDFLIKPFQIAQLSRVLKPGMEQRRLRQENAELRAQLRDRYRFDSVVGQSTAMQQVFQTLELVAPMNSTVLIHGETGSGKELIARTIHHNSPRADHRFVAFNAAAIPEGLAEAELFGHVKGAFTGAVASRVGSRMSWTQRASSLTPSPRRIEYNQVVTRCTASSAATPSRAPSQSTTARPSPERRTSLLSTKRSAARRWP